MKVNRKTTAASIGLLLVSGLLVYYFAGPVLWAQSLTEKRDSQADISRIENNISELNRGILTASQGSSEELSLDTGEQGRVSIEESDNYIEVRIADVEESTYPDDWTLLQGKTMKGLSIGSGEYARQGEDSAMTTAVKYNTQEKEIMYRVESRKMMGQTPSGQRLSLIDLEVSGDNSKEDSTEVYLEFKETVRDEFELSTGERAPIVRRKVAVSVE